VERVVELVLIELTTQIITLSWQKRQLLSETKAVDDAESAMADIVAAY
jgi:hypothetical protein